MKKPDYAAMFTLRKDGRYQGFWREDGKRHYLYDRDPERLYSRLKDIENYVAPPLEFEAAADAWEKKHWDRISNKTAEAYTAPLRRIKEQFAGINAEDITSQEIQAFLVDLGKKGFSRRSVQMHRDILNMIFNNAIIEYGTRFNPCGAVTVPRNLPKKKRDLPPDPAIKAVQSGADKPFGLFAMICLYAGLRRGEVLALTYEDIDREAGLIHVNKAVEYIGNNPHIKPPKTDAGIRDVPLLGKLAAAIPDEGSGLIFPGTGENPLTKTQYRKRWLKYCEAIGYDITAHQLRHGFATILYEARVPDKDAQELLGHSSIAVTRDIYTHIRQSQKDATVKKLNRYLETKTRKKADVKKGVKGPR